MKNHIFIDLLQTPPKRKKCGDDAPSNSKGGEGTNVWCLMLKEIEEDNLDVLEVFKLYIIYYLNIKSDKIFKAILKTLVLAREDEKMDFAVNMNRYSISQAITKVKRLNSSMTSPYWQPGLIYAWQLYMLEKNI